MVDDAAGHPRKTRRSRRGSSGRRSRRTRPDSPLPDRDGIPAVRLHMAKDMAKEAPFQTVAEFLTDKTHGATEVAARLDAGGVVLTDGTVITRQTPYVPGGWVFLYRDVRSEIPVPGQVTVLYQDENIVVVDKPHFLATMPRGSHVTETVLVRLRRQLGLPELSAAHRLDRLTAGVLMLTVRREARSDYQELFARREVRKTYFAVAPIREDLTLPREVRSRIVKERGSLQVKEVAGEINAVTGIELVRRVAPEDIVILGGEAAPTTFGLYRLTPQTGRTHQLRIHMAGLGIPIVGDPLYPTIRDAAADDFSAPLQLLAHTLEFDDPLSGESRRFVSQRRLLLGNER